MMEYLLVTVVLFGLILLYFKVADRYNIIDRPNHRSSHTNVTLRGGGIIYPLAFGLYIITLLIKGKYVAAMGMWPFAAGFLMLCAVSFADDIMNVSKKLRLVVHFLAISFLLTFFQYGYLINEFPFWTLPFCFVLAVGILNAFNFMDGINGMAGLYHLVAFVTLFYLNINYRQIIDSDFILYPILATVVFLFFNFRKKAKCFLGDVGSMAAAFWILTLIGKLFFETFELKWLLLLAVYGVDAIFTIIERIMLREDIFQAHKRHMYQLLVNEFGKPHLLVSVIYALCQAAINIVLVTTDWPFYHYLILILLPLAVLYVSVKFYLKKAILKTTKA